MATSPLDDPQDALRKRLLTRGTSAVADPAMGAPPITPAPPVVAPTPMAVPGRTFNAQPAVPADVPRMGGAPQTPASIAAGYDQAAWNALPPAQQAQYTAQGGAPGQQAPAGGANADKQWLDWINSTYGKSASRGTGFADLPQGQNLEQVVGRFNQETGANAKYLGGPSNDRVDFGQGATDALTAGGQLWSDYGAMSGPARAGASGGSGGVSLPGGRTWNEGASGGAGGAGGGDFQSQTRAMLLERLKQAGGPVDPNGGGIGEAMTGARLEADRASQMERSALAERRAASGDTSGSLEQGIQQSAERNAVGLGSLRATLIQKEYQAKRQEMSELLQLATASGDAESARSIQMQMAQLDATLRREGYGIDMAKFAQQQNSNTVGGAG